MALGALAKTAAGVGLFFLVRSFMPAQIRAYLM